MPLTAGEIVTAIDVDHVESQTPAAIRTLLGVAPSSDTAYDATSWNANTDVPTKNAVRDKIEAILAGVTFTGDVIVPDEAYDATAWNGSLEVPTKNAIRDKIETMGGGASSPLTLTSNNATETPLSIVAHASQSEPLQEWQNSGAGVLSSIQPTGHFRGNGGSVTIESEYFGAVHQITSNQSNNIPFGILHAGVGWFFVHDSSGKNTRVRNDFQWAWSSSSSEANTAADTGLKRTIAGVVGITNGSTGGGALGMQEQTAPAAPAADGMHTWVEDNGSGKSRWMCRFGSGAAIQVAIEP